MKIDHDLIERIETLNDAGVSCFAIAKQAGVQPGTVRRFVDGVSSSMEEETWMKISRAVEHFEGDAGAPPAARPDTGIAMFHRCFLFFALGACVALTIVMIFPPRAEMRIVYAIRCADQGEQTVSMDSASSSESIEDSNDAGTGFTDGF